jgi:hypothetical protein
MHPPTKRSLTPQRQRLVELFQQINFGRVEGLHVQSGQPKFDPEPTITNEFKFGSENGPREESNQSNFLLKRQIQELFDSFDQLQNGVIDVIEVKHGLPFRMEVKNQVTKFKNRKS